MAVRGPRSGLLGEAAVEVESPCAACVGILSDPDCVSKLDQLLSRREYERRLVAGRMILRDHYLEAFDAAFDALAKGGIGRG
jgi:hypothetical protein